MFSHQKLDYINEVLHETVDDEDKANLPEDWEEGLTFTAKASRKFCFTMQNGFKDELLQKHSILSYILCSWTFDEFIYIPFCWLKLMKKIDTDHDQMSINERNSEKKKTLSTNLN